MDGVPSDRPEDEVSRWDRVFTALSAEPRRQIVDELMTVPAGESIPLPDAAANSNASTDPDRLRLGLRHRHLPLLEEAGLVEWETDPFRAYRGRDFEAVSVVLESLYENAERIPDRLVSGCRRLEHERERRNSERGHSR